MNLCCILFILILGFPQAASANLVPFAPYGAQGVFNAASIVFFAYIGFDYIANCAEEVVVHLHTPCVRIHPTVCRKRAGNCT